jgi:L-fuconolactonase
MSDEIIDSHHHLWKYSQEQYPWMLEGMERLRRDFLVPDLQVVTREAGVDGTVAVQARQTLQETTWLLDLARVNQLIRGVVGWVPLVDADVAKHLGAFSKKGKLKGVRHVLQAEPNDFYMLRDDFNRGIDLLKEFDLSYDILIFERHLSQTIQFVDRHPNQRFIVDHIAKPRIKEKVLSPWTTHISELGQRENVFCKLSGMVTEADWTHLSESDLRPYFETVLAAFGPKRLMFGSDWPVVLVASEYKGWADMVGNWISALSPTDQAAIMGNNAKAAYSL